MVYQVTKENKIDYQMNILVENKWNFLKCFYTFKKITTISWYFRIFNQVE